MSKPTKKRSLHKPLLADIASYFMKAILDSSPDCMKILDRKGKLLYLSNGGLKEHNFKTHEEAVGWDWLGSIVKNQRKDALKHFARCLKGEAVSIDVQHVHGKANREWCNLSLTPIRDTNGKIINILGVSRDITERKKAETVLYESEEKFKALIESFPACIKLFDASGTLLSINAHGKEEHGLQDMSDKEIQNWNFYECIEKADHKNIKKGMEKAMKGKTDSFVIRHTHIHAQGGFCFSTLAPVYAGGKIKYVIFTSSDITELRKAQDALRESDKKLKKSYSELETRVQERTADLRRSRDKIEEEKAKAESFLSSIGEGVLALDHTGRILMMNAEAERMLGVAFRDVGNKFFGDSIHFEDKEGQRIGLNTAPMSQVVAEKKQIYAVSYFAHRSEGREAFATTFSPILIRGKLFGTIITFRDVTRDEAFSRAKSDFISLASHQLRTPLTSIKWILQEAGKVKDIQDWKREYLKDAVTSTQRMIALVHNLLNVSRLETGSIAIHPEPFDAGDFVDRFVRDEAKTVANEKRQRLNFKKPLAKIMIVADKDLFQQTISNLISNSIRYSPENTDIDIRLSKKGKTIELTVKDHGIGIGRKEQKHLFEKFFRTEEAAKYSTTGSGLGLYIVQHILSAMKGEIRYDSELGKGSAFTITLPVKSAVMRSKGNDLFAHIIS